MLNPNQHQPRIRPVEVDDEIADALDHAGYPIQFLRLDHHPTNGRLILHFNHHAHRAALAKAEDD